MKHGKKIWWVLSLLVCAVVSNPVLAMAAQESDTGDQLGGGYVTSLLYSFCRYVVVYSNLSPGDW